MAGRHRYEHQAGRVLLPEDPTPMADYEADVAAVARIKAVPTILDVICRTTGMGFAAVARVTEDRWIACSVHDSIQFGLKPGGELKIETTICNDIRKVGKPVVIDDVAQDAVYAGHHTPALYGFQSYISVPIWLQDGSFFGTLCAIDPRPAKVNTPETIGMFQMFAELIAFHLSAVERITSTEASLMTERETSALREQFIAVLGHDLRNPLASIDAGMRMILKAPLDERTSSIVVMVQNSVTRIGGIIDSVLDFARGRLGGGLTLDRNADEALEPVLLQVIAELQTSFSGRAIEANLVLVEPVHCDRVRIGQLFSNLLGNALSYGAADTTISVSAVSNGGLFELTITNLGDAIAPEALARLFEPFSRGAVEPNRKGLGLGLYIASEIARAHEGRIDVTSTAESTQFTFNMPTKPKWG